MEQYIIGSKQRYQFLLVTKLNRHLCRNYMLLLLTWRTFPNVVWNSWSQWGSTNLIRRQVKHDTPHVVRPPDLRLAVTQCIQLVCSANQFNWKVSFSNVIGSKRSIHAFNRHNYYKRKQQTEAPRRSVLPSFSRVATLPCMHSCNTNKLVRTEIDAHKW